MVFSEVAEVITLFKRVEEIELLNLFPPNAGIITQYYGRIGSGKTYAATADIFESLRRGKVIYANWKIHYEGYDQRDSLAYIILSFILPWRRRFYVFPKENLRYFEFSDTWAQTQGYPDFVEWLASRTDCEIYGDEGHVMFDSYAGTRMSIEKRMTVLHTRHFDRSIHIISQRPTAVHVAMRANVNVFYQCKCLFQWGSLVRFKRTEFQDMLNENVDEDTEKALGVKYYWGKQKIFEAYNTKYLRGDIKPSQSVLFKAYDVNIIGRTVLFIKKIFGSKKKREYGPIEPSNDKKVIHRLSTPVARHLTIRNIEKSAIIMVPSTSNELPRQMVHDGTEIGKIKPEVLQASRKKGRPRKAVLREEERPELVGNLEDNQTT